MLLNSMLITIMFLISGIYKFQGFDATINGFAGKTGLDVSISTIAIAMAAVLQITAPLVIMYEAYYKTGKYRKYAQLSCYGLAGFTVMATLIYHYPPTGNTYYPFISNVTTFGALLLLAEHFE